MTKHPWWASRYFSLSAFFVILIISKWTYRLWRSEQAHQRWLNQGLFAYNSEADFLKDAATMQWYGLFPYVILAVVVILSSRSRVLGIATGLCLAIADIGTDWVFTGSKDGQTGIAIFILYSFCFIMILLGFLASNWLLSRRQARQPLRE